MGQIVGGAAKPKRCNLNKLSQLGTPAAGEHILVSSDNSMNAAGQGNFDAYIVGNGHTVATALELKKINPVDSTLTSGSELPISSGGLYELLYGKNIVDNIVIERGGSVNFDAITLLQAGDYIEVVLKPKYGEANGAYTYAAVGNSNISNGLQLGVGNAGCSLKDANNVWIVNPNNSEGSYGTKTSDILTARIELFQSSSVLTIKNASGTIIFTKTHNALTSFRFDCFANLKYSTYYWSGTIYSLKAKSGANEYTLDNINLVNVEPTKTTINRTQLAGKFDEIDEIGEQIEEVSNDVETNTQAINDLNEKAGIIALENGGIVLSNGQNAPSSKRVRSGFITTPFRIECNTGYSLYAVIQYKNDGTYSKAMGGITLGQTPNYELAKDDYLYRIVFSKTDYAQDIDASENIITSFDARSTFFAKTKSSVTLSLDTNTKELILMVDGVATRGNYGFTFLGLATPSTNPYTPVGLRASYLAKEPGTYPNFGGLTVYSDEYAIFIWRNLAWEKISIAKDSRAINGLVVLDAWAASLGSILTEGQYGWSTAQKKVVYRSFDGNFYFIDPADSCLYLYNGKYYRYVDNDMVLQDYDVNHRFDKTLQALLGISWSLGQLYSNGGADSSKNKFIISNYFPVPAGTVIKCHDVSKYGYYLARYKSDNKIEPLADNLIEYYSMASLANDTDGVEISEFCYVRICAYQKPVNTIVVSEDDIYNIASRIFIDMPSYSRITERMASVPNTIGLATDMLVTDDYEYTGNLFNIPYNPSSPESVLVAFYNLWDELASTYPLWVTKEVLGKDATNTYDILHYSINPHTDVQINGAMGRASAKNLRILLLGGTHGSEYLAHYSMYMFVKDLLENHDNNDALSYIWYNSVFEVIPTINPYGFAHYTVTNGNGVNLNRNFDINWQYIADGVTKSGDAPFSEVETNIVVNFVNSFSDVFLTIFPHVSGLVDSNKNIAYIMTAFRSDGNIGLVFGKTLQKYVREHYPFVFSESSIFSQALVYKSVAPGNTITGTAADWLAYHGKHGFILEVGDLWGTSFPTGTRDDMQRIYITIFGRLLRVFISKNRDVLSDNYAFIPLVKYSPN